MSDAVLMLLLGSSIAVAFGLAIYAGWYESRVARRDVDELDPRARIAVERAVGEIDSLRQENAELRARLRGGPFR